MCSSSSIQWTLSLTGDLAVLPATSVWLMQIELNLFTANPIHGFRVSKELAVRLNLPKPAFSTVYAAIISLSMSVSCFHSSLTIHVCHTPSPVLTVCIVLWYLTASPCAEHVRGRAGGGWDYGEVAAPPRRTQEATPTVIPTVNEGVAETDHTQSTDRELESEVRLVESITQVGGVRVAPPRDQLQQFVER